jgi:transposase
MTSWSWPASRSPSPTPRRSRAWPRLPVRPTDRRLGAGRAVPPRPGPRDLAAYPRGAGRAGTGRFRLHLVRHRTALKNRVHATLLAFGKPCPVSDLFGAGGRQLLGRLALAEPWIGNVTAALALIDDLDERVAGCERDLRHLGADHPYVPLLRTAPGIAWVLGYTIAAELGDIARFSSPKKLCGYTGLCPRVYQSGSRDQRGPLAKNGPP